jgi:TfoX/Sxy family transcriptional regulator of competence genes
MFGHPCAFLNGHMFTGLFGDDWFVRLGLEDRATLLDLPGAAPFEPMPGRPMSGYAVVPRDLTGDPEAARPWVERAATFAASLPPKAAKKSAKAPGARKTHSGR